MIEHVCSELVERHGPKAAYDVLLAWKRRYNQRAKVRDVANKEKLVSLKDLLEYREITQLRSVVGIGQTFYEFWGEAKPVYWRKKTHAEQYMEDGSRKKMARYVQYRVSEELRHAEEQCWYTVMDTITLDPRQVARRESFFSGPEWQAYIRGVSYDVAKVCRPDLTARQVQKEDRRQYARYMAVLEGGDTNPHVHVVWTFKDVPDKWKRDPNAGRRFPNRRICSAMKSHWRCGFSKPLIFRTGTQDAWAVRAGHVWPCADDGTMVPNGGAIGAALYVSKYITKGQPEKWKTVRRVRSSIRYGNSYLVRMLAQVPQSMEQVLLPQRLVTMPRTPEKYRVPKLAVSMTLQRKFLLDKLQSRPVQTCIDLFTATSRESLYQRYNSLQKKTGSEYLRMLRSLEASEKDPFFDAWKEVMAPFSEGRRVNINSLKGTKSCRIMNVVAT